MNLVDNLVGYQGSGTFTLGYNSSSWEFGSMGWDPTNFGPNSTGTHTVTVTQTGDSNYEAGSTTFDLIVNEAGRPHGRPAFLCKTPMTYQSQNNAVVSRFVRRSFGKTTPLF